MTSLPSPDACAPALDALFEPVCRSDAPGLVVGVASRGRTVYRRGFGLANVEHGVANTPRTRMRIGSTSKQFTCLAALLLAEDGRLDLDADVRTWLPELPGLTGPGGGPGPTLRQLMTHTGGLRCHLDLGFIADGMAIKPAGVAMDLLRRQRAVNFAPGTNMVYCNSGYHLLSRVIERVAGLPFEAFLQQRILVPLGMRDTASLPGDVDVHPGMAGLYLPRPAGQGGGWRRGLFPSEELLGEGAMVSTIDDMLRWLAHLRAPHKRVGSADSWRQMLTPAALGNGLVNPYALGLMRHDYRGVALIHHPGGVVGGASQMLTVPSHALDVVVIANGAPVSPRDLALRIVDALLGDPAPGDAGLGAPAVAVPAAGFAPMLGRRYHGRETGLVFGFERAEGGALGFCLMNGPPIALRDDGAHVRLPFEELAMGPFVLPRAALAREGAAPPVLDLVEAGRGERCDLLPQAPPTAREAGVPLLGRYRCPDLDADAQLVLEGDTLQLRIRGPYGRNRVDLQPLSADVFGGRELDSVPGRGAVLRVVERRAGRVCGLRLDTPRTRQLAFERCAD